MALKIDVCCWGGGCLIESGTRKKTLNVFMKYLLTVNSLVSTLTTILRNLTDVLAKKVTLSDMRKCSVSAYAQVLDPRFRTEMMATPKQRSILTRFEYYMEQDKRQLAAQTFNDIYEFVNEEETNEKPYHFTDHEFTHTHAFCERWTESMRKEMVPVVNALANAAQKLSSVTSPEEILKIIVSPHYLSELLCDGDKYKFTELWIKILNFIMIWHKYEPVAYWMNACHSPTSKENVAYHRSK